MVIKTSLALYVLYIIGFAILYIFQCGKPIPQHFIFIDHCMSWPKIMGPVNYVAAVLNGVIDWIFTGIAIATVWKVQLSRRGKISVCGLIAFGAIGSLLSLARIPLVPELRLTGHISDFHKVLPIAMLSLAESAIGIIALCIAGLKPLYLRFRRGAELQNGSRSRPFSEWTRPRTAKSGVVANNTLGSVRDLDDAKLEKGPAGGGITVQTII